MENSYFLQELKEMLTEEDYAKFVSTFSVPMYKALRINTNKANYEKIAEEISLNEPSEFDRDTYLIDDDAKLGNHPYHIGGLYYLQEPSATMVVNALDITPGDRVLDLCAAPGGKSTHILSKLNGTGFLVSNEYDKKRANILLSNLERWGSQNYLLTNNTVEDLCPRLAGYFDKIVVDAPCSGASMFKKYPETIKDYNHASVLACQKRQLNILDYAYIALKAEGTLVYSTCTYNKYEDEYAVQEFLKKHPDCELVDTGVTAGRKGFDEQGLTRRCFPMDHGEGHFMAKIIKHSDTGSLKIKSLPFSSDKLVDEFIKNNCTEKLHYTIIKDKVYVSQERLLDLKANILRQGVLLGEIVKNRIEPAHHFFIALDVFKNVYELVDANELKQYLSGLSLMVPNFKGYVQIRYKGVPIGFGKADGTQIKNHFPKGLRIA